MTNRLSPYVICRLSIAFVWLYHGLVPKLLSPHEDELAMNMALGLSRPEAIQLSQLAGLVELLIGSWVLFYWHQRWPLAFTALAMIGLLLFAVAALPSLAMAAFNPVTTNICALVLSVVAWQLHPNTTQ